METCGPDKPRLFFARAHLTWSGTLAAAWQVAFVIVVGTQASGTVVHRNLYSGMLAVAFMFSSLCFWFNAVYWGPSAGWRKGLGWSELCRRVVGETQVSYEKRMSRLIRCYGDQALHGWIVGASAYTMIFLLNFYWHNGIHDFLPPLVYGIPDVPNFLTMQKFYSIEAAIGGVAFVIVLATFFLDLFKRYVLETSTASAVTIPDGTTSTGAQLYSGASPLTGNMHPK